MGWGRGGASGSLAGSCPVPRGPAGSQALGWVQENTLVFSPKGLVSTQDASGAMLGTEEQLKPTEALLSGLVGAQTFKHTHTVTRCGTF